MKTNKKLAKMFVCGDIVNHTKMDGLICSDDLATQIVEADCSVCNFEAPVGGYETPQQKAGCHLFQQKATISGLKMQGFDLLLLANNHMLDYGKEALNATFQEIAEQRLDSIGAGLSYEAAYQPLYKTICNMKFGFINACEAQFGVIDHCVSYDKAGYAWINHSQIDKNIIELKKQCDFVVVFAHAGLENVSVPQPEWRDRYKHFCDLGADCIIGSHPHVPQGYERYNQSLIFYSLGNFYFDSKNHIAKEDRSYSVLLDFQIGQPINLNLIYHHKEGGQVRLSPNNKTIDIDELNIMLTSNYEQLVDDMSLQVYKTILKPNLTRSLCPLGYSGNIKSVLRYFIDQLQGKREKYDNHERLLLHLIKNESYRFAIERALGLITN